MKTYLEPLASLGSRLEGIFKPTVGIIALSRLVRGAIALSARLSPDEGVNKLVTSLGGGALAKAGVDDVAPVAPFNLAGGLVSIAAWKSVRHNPFRSVRGATYQCRR